MLPLHVGNLAHCSMRYFIREMLLLLKEKENRWPAWFPQLQKVITRPKLY